MQTRDHPRIRPVAIDGALFQNEVEARQIMSVPIIFFAPMNCSSASCAACRTLA
jgi:alkyl hydroperoxide reductase subunit AhpF